MCGERGIAALSVAMPGFTNQLQLPSIPHAIRPGLVAGIDPVLSPGNWSISVSSVFKSCITGRSSAPGKFQPVLSCRRMFAPANPWVINARSGGNLHEPRADGGRTDQPRRTRLRHFLAPPERAHHLRDRTGRGWHVDANGGTAAVPRSRESEEGNLDVHQLAGRRRDVGPCDLRHHAVHPSAGFDALHWAGGIDGLVAAGGRPQGHALLVAEFAYHGAP